MCGIIGILGKSEVQDRLLDGLARLEYRGYDSAGIAVVDRATVSAVKAVGKLENLRSALVRRPLVGCVGIGHTRWATHGAANEVNAHPHCAENVTVAHNGIIKNHAEIKEELRALGVVVVSDTDAEVNAAEVSARGARVVFVGSNVSCELDLVLPEVPDLLLPFVQALAVQMISYYAALAKGTYVDQPKNLAKSVTVE